MLFKTTPSVAHFSNYNVLQFVILLPNSCPANLNMNFIDDANDKIVYNFNIIRWQIIIEQMDNIITESCYDAKDIKILHSSRDLINKNYLFHEFHYYLKFYPWGSEIIMSVLKLETLNFIFKLL